MATPAEITKLLDKLCDNTCADCKGSGVWCGEKCYECGGLGRGRVDDSNLRTVIQYLLGRESAERKRTAAIVKNCTDVLERRLRSSHGKCGGCECVVDALRDLAAGLEVADENGESK